MVMVMIMVVVMMIMIMTRRSRRRSRGAGAFGGHVEESNVLAGLSRHCNLRQQGFSVRLKRSGAHEHQRKFLLPPTPLPLFSSINPPHPPHPLHLLSSSSFCFPPSSSLFTFLLVLFLVCYSLAVFPSLSSLFFPSLLRFLVILLTLPLQPRSVFS